MMSNKPQDATAAMVCRYRYRYRYRLHNSVGMKGRCDWDEDPIIGPQQAVQAEQHISSAVAYRVPAI
jgi:hypothetical protein